MRNKTFPKKGAWILIINEVSTGGFHPLFSVWFAKPYRTIYFDDERTPHSYFTYGECFEKYNVWYKDLEYFRASMVTYLYGDRKTIGDTILAKIEQALDKGLIVETMVTVKTPFGNVLLQPEEYNIVDVNDYIDMSKDGCTQVIYMGANNKGFSNKTKDQLFYIKNRGISSTTALKMISGGITNQNSFYILTHPECRKIYDRYHDRHMKSEDLFLAKSIKKDPNTIRFFFNEKEALILNQKYGGQ